jgi:hypothetical protein
MDEKSHYDTARSAAGVKYPFVSLEATCLRRQDDFMDEERFLLGPGWRDYNPETLPSWMINSFFIFWREFPQKMHISGIKKHTLESAHKRKE